MSPEHAQNKLMPVIAEKRLRNLYQYQFSPIRYKTYQSVTVSSCFTEQAKHPAGSLFVKHLQNSRKPDKNHTSISHFIKYFYFFKSRTTLKDCFYRDLHFTVQNNIM